jgi:hypothetical protein
MNLDPIDPLAVPIELLKARAHYLMTHRNVLPPDDPLAPGWFKCFICWRVRHTSRTHEEALEAYERQFGEPPPPPEDTFILCTDCATIVADDMGVPRPD